MRTVGIAAYNEAKSIGKALERLVKQLGEGDEVLVVASGCMDGTEEVVRRFSDADARVKLIVEEKRFGKAVAVNRILVAARNETVVLTDADVLVAEDALEKISAGLSGGVGATVARTCSYKMENFLDKMQAWAWETLNEARARESRCGKLFALNGYLSGVRRSVVEKIPADALTEDWALGWAVKEKGYRVEFRPGARVYVQAPQNLGDWLEQKTRVRMGQMQLVEKGMPGKRLRGWRQATFLLKSGYAWAYLALDALCWGMAWWRLRRGKTAWKPIDSTKI